MESLQVFGDLSQDQSSKSVAAALAAQEAVCKASEAADLQHEAANFHIKACHELRRITESTLRLAQVLGVLVPVQCDKACVVSSDCIAVTLYFTISSTCVCCTPSFNIRAPIS